MISSLRIHQVRIMNKRPQNIDRQFARIRDHYSKPPKLTRFSLTYRKILAKYFSYLIPEKSSTFEVGCGQGHLLENLPNRAVGGVDLVEKQIENAQNKLPELNFQTGAAETVQIKSPFKSLLLSDLLNETTDVQTVLQNLADQSEEETRLFINAHNTLWRPILGLATLFSLKPTHPPLSWLSKDDILNLLDLGGWEVVRYEARILCPHPLLGIGTLINRYIAPLFPWLCLCLFFVARPKPLKEKRKELSVSVIIPARNEAGNLRAAVERTPDMGTETEILFIEGNSQDNTWETIQEIIKEYPDKKISAYQQTGKGKGDAMRLGYEKASNELIMILDADLTVPPEDLPKFYEAIASGQAEFANGVRLVYPMEDEAMRFLNMCGNKFFSLLFSWLLNLPIKDTLCGTKVFTKTNYERIAANRSYFGDFDPFGDFDLIFGAAKLNLKIRDIPIRYQSRTYGEPQIDRWRDGALLIRMAVFAARKLKFI